MKWREFRALILEMDNTIDDEDEVAVSIGYKADNLTVHQSAKPRPLKQFLEGWIKHDKPCHVKPEEIP